MLGPGARIALAFRCFFALLFKGRLPEGLLDRLGLAEPPAPAPPEAPPAADAGSTARAVQLLGILQRDGRLIDFLQEDITPYADAQIGAAVRDVHGNCRAALARYATIEPIVGEPEGDRIRIGDADPARFKLVGAVGRDATVDGIVRHRGWRVTRIELPPLPATGQEIVAPVEVEVV